MDSAITGLIILALLLLTVFTVAQGYLSLQDRALGAWREMEMRMAERVHTDLAPVSAETKASGSIVELTLANEGDVKLADFDRWDVIVEYDASSGDHIIDWIPYEELTENRWWTVKGIYLDASAGITETFEPNILNPGEEVIIQLWLSPTVGLTTTNLATVATPNGISASQVFTR